MKVLRRAIVALCLSAAPAVAHDIYSTWRTPRTNAPCCGKEDCRVTTMCRLPDGTEGIQGATQCQQIPWERNLPSPDGQTHICEWGGRVQCLAIGGWS